MSVGAPALLAAPCLVAPASHAKTRSMHELAPSYLPPLPLPPPFHFPPLPPPLTSPPYLPHGCTGERRERPVFWKGAFGPLPKYCHSAATTCRQRLLVADRVYRLQAALVWCTGKRTYPPLPPPTYCLRPLTSPPHLRNCPPYPAPLSPPPYPQGKGGGGGRLRAIYGRPKEWAPCPEPSRIDQGEGRLPSQTQPSAVQSLTVGAAGGGGGGATSCMLSCKPPTKAKTNSR